MDDCIFCKMVKGIMAVPKVYEDDSVIVIKDINPQAPRHLLAIPREHYSSIHEVPTAVHSIFEAILNAVQTVVIKEGIADKGYRLVVNSGSAAGQSVDHIHIHILSGRTMHWPPG